MKTIYVLMIASCILLDVFDAAQGAEGLVEAVDKIYTAMRKGTHSEYDRAVENYNDAWGKLEATALSCAGYLQIDAEKSLRKQMPGKRVKNASSRN